MNLWKSAERNKMKIQLSEHFTFKKLLLFVYPSVIMMIFTSIYVVIDGLFVSNYVGKTAFAAINLISPFIMALSALGFMMGTGGSAIVAKTLGEGKKQKASEYFSMLVYITALGGVLLSIAGIALTPAVARLLGAEGDLLRNCTIYGRLGLSHWHHLCCKMLSRASLWPQRSQNWDLR